MCNTCGCCRGEDCWPYVPQGRQQSPLTWVDGLNSDGCERFMKFTDFFNPCYLGSQITRADVVDIVGSNGDNCLVKEAPLHFLARHISNAPGNALSVDGEGLYTLVNPVYTGIAPISVNGTVISHNPSPLGAGVHTTPGQFILSFTTDPEGHVTAYQTAQQTQLVAIDSSTIDLTAQGTDGHTLTASVKISTLPNNSVLVNADGIYVPTACEQAKLYPEEPLECNIDYDNGGFLAIAKDGRCVRHTPTTQFRFFGSLVTTPVPLTGGFGGMAPLPGPHGATYTFTICEDQLVRMDFLTNVLALSNGGAPNPNNSIYMQTVAWVDGVQTVLNNGSLFGDGSAGSSNEISMLGMFPLTAGTHTVQVQYWTIAVGTPAVDLYVANTGIIPTWTA